MTGKPAWMDGLDQEQIDFYLALEPAVAVCRGKRRHKFPGLDPSKPTPDTIDIRRDREGIYIVTEWCERDCGRFIWYEAGTDGYPDYTKVHYGGWEVGKQLSKGLGITAGDDALHMAYIQQQAVIDGFKLKEKQRRAAARRAKEAALDAEMSKAGIL